MTEKKNFKELARKYRPATLSGLIGQEALVRTLTNEINNGRIPPAILLSGIRGTGKTSTARILARALLCDNGPTPTPCCTCQSCRDIDTDSHIDVLETDGATQTGVDNVREIIERTRYAPSQGRYKIFIIDEVHMLSKGAFNALLKTLEEPPVNVIFIFATTEARRIPATVLSRCQRFDLRRVEPERLSTHYKWICEKEGVVIDDEALALISNAADGSVRDGLSILDQAISQSADNVVNGATIRTMLGLADRIRAIAVADAMFAGNLSGTITAFREAYNAGIDPATILRDLLDYVHFVCVAAAAPQNADASFMLTETQAKQAMAQARAAGAAGAHGAWLSLLKGLTDLQSAHNAGQAAEMCLIRTAGGLIRKAS